jgi:prepilin-type N-terminal cleavage/methylation domain-containing protein
MLTRWRAAAADDRGMTLIELVVGMTLATILGAATLLFFVQANDTTSSTVERDISTAQARSLLQSWSTYFHVADDPTASGLAINRFEWFTATSVAFHSDILNRDAGTGTTGVPWLVWLRLDGNAQLVEETFTSTPTHYPAAPSRCRILTGPITAPSLFTAYNSTGTSLTGQNQDLGAAPGVSAGCRSLPSAVPSQQNNPDPIATTNLQNISSVAIAFTATDTQGDHRVGYQTVVAVPVLQALS